MFVVRVKMITRHRRRRSFLCASGAGQATGLQKHMYKYSPVENRWFQSLLWQHGLYPVAPPRGALVGLVPQTKLQPPPNWTMKHYKLLFFLLLMLFRSVCHQVSNQTNRWISSSGDYILISANVSPTYSLCPEEAQLNRWAKRWLIIKYNTRRAYSCVCLKKLS